MQIEKWEQPSYSKGRQASNTIVILDKDSYLKSVETLLKGSSKSKNIPIAPSKDFNYVITFEKESLVFWKNFKTKTQSV